MTGHILTIEDPVEYQFKNKKSIVNQREIGGDTQSLQTALKNALRQAPDVILIGEIRDRETMSAAIAYAQSGHLCLATLHGNNSYHALNRILSFTLVEVRPPCWATSSALKASCRSAWCAPRWRPRAGGRGHAQHQAGGRPDRERRLLRRARGHGKSMAEGSQTFEEALARLILSDKIDRKGRPGLRRFAHQPHVAPAKRLHHPANAAKAQKAGQRASSPDEEPSFTEIVLDVKPALVAPVGPRPAPLPPTRCPHPAPDRTTHRPPSITPRTRAAWILLTERLAPGLCLRTAGQRAAQLPRQQFMGKRPAAWRQ